MQPPLRRPAVFWAVCGLQAATDITLLLVIGFGAPARAILTAALAAAICALWVVFLRDQMFPPIGALGGQQRFYDPAENEQDSRSG